MNADDLAWSQAEFKSLREELISLRQRGLARPIKEGTEYTGLLAIARGRGATGLGAWALRDLLREAVEAIEGSEKYCEAIRADYGITDNFGDPYPVRRAAARKIYDDVSESVWEKTQPQMADTLTESLLRLRERDAGSIPAQQAPNRDVVAEGSPESAPKDDPTRDGAVRRPPHWLFRQPRMWPIAVSATLCVVTAVLVVANIFGSHQSIQPSIIDATTGRLLIGAAATPHADQIGDVKHLIPDMTTACVNSLAVLHPPCVYQGATRYVCGALTSAVRGGCSNAAIYRTFHAQIGDSIHFRVPLSDATLTPLPFIALYLQSIRYARPTNKTLIQITAQWPSPAYAGGRAVYHLLAPEPLCPPGGLYVCPAHPQRNQYARDEQRLAQLSLEFPASEEGRLNYVSGSATLLDDRGHALATLPGDILDMWGIALANLEPASKRILAFEVLVESP